MASISGDEQLSTGYYDLIRRNDNFRFLWMGQIISLLGDWFNLIASASLVAALTQSGLAVGVLFVIRMLAQFFISPLAGVAADRFNRKGLLIGSDIARAVTVFGFLLVRSAEQLWLLYTLTAIQLAISGVFFPARNAILPDIVKQRELGAANALTSATWSVMLALGAALGGLVSGGWGIYPAFVIDGITFLISAVLIAGIQYTHETAIQPGEESIAMALRQFIDGLKYLRANMEILAIAVQKAAMALVTSGGFQVVQVALAERIYVIGEGGGISLGIMYAVLGVGTGVGPILARRLTGDRKRPLLWAVVGSYAVSALGLFLVAPLFNFGAVLAGTFVRAAGGGINWVFSSQLLLQMVPNRVRGRVFSTEFAFFTLANAAAAAGGGLVLDNTDLGIQGLVWWMAGLTLLLGVIWILWGLAASGSTVASDQGSPQ